MTDWTGCGFNTALLHAGSREEIFGATLPPVYQTSAFQHKSAEELEKIFANKAPGFSYTRIGNPTVSAFEQKMTQLEGGAASAACASGMAALSGALLNLVRAGDEIVAAAGLYGGTVELLHSFEALGIRTRYVPKNTVSEYEKRINGKTRVVFAETIGNPRLDVTDIAAVAEMAHRYGIPLVIDNTVATAYLVQPLKLGADVVVNSSSKYINGSSDAISGVLTYSGKFDWDVQRYSELQPYRRFGRMSYMVRLRQELLPALGACLAPQNALLNCIGLETLGLRMERQCANAQELAQFLEQLGGVTVNYPGLQSSAYYALSQRQFRHGSGAIITFRAGSKERAFQILNALTIPYLVSNIGDTKTLVIHPASTLAVHLSPEEQAASGVYDDLIRVSVGIEDIEDLKRDFSHAVKGE